MLSCTCIPYSCESFNSYIRSHNIFGNKQAPSRDIAHRFAVLEHIRFTCSSKRYVNMYCAGLHHNILMCRSGQDLQRLYQLPTVQEFCNSVSKRNSQCKEIYNPATLRKVHDYMIYINIAWLTLCNYYRCTASN